MRCGSKSACPPQHASSRCCAAIHEIRQVPGPSNRGEQLRTSAASQNACYVMSDWASKLSECWVSDCGGGRGFRAAAPCSALCPRVDDRPSHTGWLMQQLALCYAVRQMQRLRLPPPVALTHAPTL